MSAWRHAARLLEAYGSLTTTIPLDEKQKLDRAVDAVTRIDHDLIGGTDKAKHLIMALVERTGLAPAQQQTIAHTLGVQVSPTGQQQPSSSYSQSSQQVQTVQQPSTAFSRMTNPGA